MLSERTTWIEDRVRAAGRLILAATNELVEDPPQGHLALINLELVTLATSQVLRHFIGELVQRRPPRSPEDCPHCGHPRFYEKLERCARCSGLRGVSRELAASDPVRLHRVRGAADRLR